MGRLISRLIWILRGRPFGEHPVQIANAICLDIRAYIDKTCHIHPVRADSHETWWWLRELHHNLTTRIWSHSDLW